jgi:hypothetical protein
MALLKQSNTTEAGDLLTGALVLGQNMRRFQNVTIHQASHINPDAHHGFKASAWNTMKATHPLVYPIITQCQAHLF